MSKKTSTKKAVKKKTTQPKVLRPAPSKSYFFLGSGEAIKSVKGLADALEKMPEEVFKHHVNQEKNDFANWIEHVFEDKTLAKKIGKDKKNIRLNIYKYLLEKKR